MISWKTTSACAAAFGILFTGSTAFAEVTAEQVWGNWKDYMSGFGYEISASENTSGDTLTISDISMSFDLPQDDGSIGINIGEFSFTNNDDGSVSVSVPPVTPITININPANDTPADLVLLYATTGYTMNISGDPDDMTYNYSVASVAISLENMVIDGQDVDVGEASLSIADIIGSTSIKSGDLRTTKQKIDTGAINITVDITNPEGSGRVVVNGDYSGINFEGSGSFPAEMDVTDMAAMLASGFAFDGKYSFADGTASFGVQDGKNIAQGSSKSDGGFLEIALDKTRLQYAGGSKNIELQLSGDDIPLPIEMAMGEWGFNLLMPISKSDEEQGFALSMVIGDLTISDQLWSLADPTSTLPRDPATVAFDISGKAKLFFDIMNEKEMQNAAMGGQEPGELNALQLNSLTVKAAGAELTGGGAFTFDNSDLTTFDGIPAPTGAIDLKLIGLNGLLDNLVAIGIMPEDQVMGMRMMMGMFAVVSEGDDTLTSKIEVSGDGQIKANGQRIQ